MRDSSEQYDDTANLINGYDYQLQVWVRHGIVLDCHHPLSIEHGDACCAARHYHALPLQIARQRAAKAKLPH